ncbi:MAG: cysteine desulfurase family protein [Candidatus Acidiferrales bacterium]
MRIIRLAAEAPLTPPSAPAILVVQAENMRVYLDSNATTAVDPSVLEAMVPFLTGDFGNASSIHTPGQRARRAVDEARTSVAALIGAKPGEIVFTSGGTEADNLAVFGAVAASRWVSKHVITTAIEHPAVLDACAALESRGIAVTFIPVGSDGVVSPEEIRRALRDDTVMISVMHANNELGTIQPIEEIGQIAREAKVLFHTDAVQSAGKILLDVDRLGADLLSLSAHKIYGPKGVGALYVRSGTPLEPQFHGGHHERDRRPGTENVPGIAGFGRAAQLARARVADDSARVAALRDHFESALLDAIPASRVNGLAAGAAGAERSNGAPREHRVANTLNILIPGAGGESLVIALDLQGIACSTGAACSSGAVEPSHVLLALGLSADEARSSLRFSLGRNTTAEEIDYAVSVIPGAVERLRAISPTSVVTVAAS